MPLFNNSKKVISEDEESDDMGSSKQQQQQQQQNNKKTIKKRKRKGEEQEDNSHTNIVVVPTSPTITNNNNEPERKKMKKEKKPKQKATPKKKAPLDLDRQCGVLIAPTNHPCTRSLTCKIHAMGAKRAVEGRSQPFNELLAAYQKKGIGRPQVPGSSSSSSGMTETSNNKPSIVQPTTTVMTTTTNIPTTTTTTNIIMEDIDSDEETENVRLAIEQNKPIPLGTKKLFYVRRKRKYYKLRDILLEAITPKETSTSSATATISPELSF